MMRSWVWGALFVQSILALQTPLKTEGQVSVYSEPAQYAEKQNHRAVASWQKVFEQVTPPSSQSLVSMAVVACAFFLTLTTMCLGPFKSAGKSLGFVGRSMLLDNAKVAAQFFVIYVHLISYNAASHSSATSASDAATSGFSLGFNIYTDASTVAVPMLCFISGVLSQGPANDVRMRRFIQSLVAPALIWVFFMKPVVLDTMTDPSIQGFYTRVQSMCSLGSFHEEWYLQALILWRSAVFLIFAHLRPPAALMSMLALSCSAGYFQFTGPLWHLKLDQALGYLPYFGIGYVFPFEMVQERTEKRQLLGPSVATGILLVWMLLIGPQLAHLPDHEESYLSGAAGSIFKQLSIVDRTLYWSRRLARVALEMPAILLIIFCLVPRSKTWFSWVGPYVLYPYLFHGFAVHLQNQLVHHVLQSSPNFANSSMLYPTLQLLNVLYALAVLLILASRPWRMLFSWGLEPTWLGLLFTSQPHLEHTKQVSDGMHRSSSSESVSSSSSGDIASLQQDSHTGSTGSTISNLEDHTSANTTMTLSGSALPSVPSDNDDDDAASVVSIPEMCPSGPTRVDEAWQSTGPAIPWQSASRFLYPSLLPIFFLSIICTATSVILMFLYVPGWKILMQIVANFPFPLAVIIYVAALALPVVKYAYHYWRLCGSVEVPEATAASPLIHAVVVCAYKEPVEVLTRTMDSIVAQKGLSRKPVVVFASEARDPTAQACFNSLSQHVGSAFELFLLTKHELKEGETIGKSSNENWAVQELYRLLIKEQANDPFEVMVTIVDADSILSSTYLAHVESSFRNQRDGRRLIFNGPLNVYRNIVDADFFVQAYEIARCHDDLFHDVLRPYMPQSNYSLTLGFCQEIDFWTPDVMPEDIHTCNKAKLNNFGGWSCVAIPSIICNDVVIEFGDRYTQAKRHQFGSITEFAWVISLWFEKKLSFQVWVAVFMGEMARSGSFLDVATSVVGLAYKLFFLIFFLTHLDEFHFKLKLFGLMALSLVLWQYLLFWAAEFMVWYHLMPQFDVKLPSPVRWFALALTFPFITFAGGIVFYIWATLDALWHITFKGELAYVCAPKGDEHGTKPATPPAIAEASNSHAGLLLQNAASEPPPISPGQKGSLATDLFGKLEEASRSSQQIAA